MGRVLLSVRVKARGIGGESAVECTCESWRRWWGECC